MSNNTKIRTMQDDLNKTRDNTTEINEQKKSYSEATQKKEQSRASRLNTVKPVISDAQQQPTKDTIKQQDDKLKELIKKISSQTDKDPDNEYQAKEKENVVSKETEIVDELARENKASPTLNEEDTVKEITDKTTKQETINNTDDIDALKNLIHRISEPNLSSKEKSKNNAVDLESSKEKIITDSETIQLDQQPEKNIQKDLAEKKPTKEKQIEKEKIIDSSAIKENKKSFWKNISEKLKKTHNSEKINDFKNKNKLSDVKATDNNKTEKFNNQSGILRSIEDTKQNETRRKEDSPKKTYYDKNYIPPNERLIHGKQRYYSSVSKRIKLKEKKDELNDLKDVAKIKKQEKIITKEEEYKKLKQGIIQKYHIKIFSLPWKKIIPIAFITILLTGIVSYFIFSYIKPPAPPAPPEFIAGSELKEFSNVEKKITITKEDLKGNDALLKIKAEEIFGYNSNIKIIKLIIIDNNTEKNILPLNEALDTIGIINIEKNINYLPNGFLQATTNNYNLFIFQSRKKSIRYGLAIKINNKDSMSKIMKLWEQERAKNKKMTTVLKPLFIDDRNFEDVFNPSLTAIYKNVKIRYISLTDKETALDYFIHKNILVFATSKNSAFTMVDLLTSEEQD